MISLKKYPENSVFVIGGGHFGGRASVILSEKLGHENIFLVDKDEESLSCLGDIAIKKIKHEGIGFLVDNFPRFDPDHTIVPAIPVHLAFLWLKAFVSGKYEINRIRPPQEIIEALPNILVGTEGSMLASYADFICPEDCPESDYCTVTGERRVMPLYKLFKSLGVHGFGVHVLRSRQLAPGVGGYKVAEMLKMVQSITGSKIGKWLLGTSCRCHGIMTSFEIKGV